MKTIESRGYRYIPDGLQYSSGIAALPGYAFRRIRLKELLPMQEGFEWIEAYCGRSGLTPAALVACELRSPAPMTPDGFRAFNVAYADKLRGWKIFEGDDNPVARSNVCPAVDAPAESGFHAFTIAVKGTGDDDGLGGSFVIAGGAETRAGATKPEERIVAFRDTSPAGIAAKARQTVAVIGARLSTFGLKWSDTTAIQTYTVFDLPPTFRDDLATRGGWRDGLTWHLCRPPVVDVDFEIDCRGIGVEQVVSPADLPRLRDPGA